MAMVKKHYLTAYPEKKVFVQRVSDWVSAPDADLALLTHAVNKFGLMPAQSIDPETKRAIAEYIYDNLPSGHGGCHQGEKRKFGVKPSATER